jgi:O-antigen/teichoic acid export membrane protein
MSSSLTKNAVLTLFANLSFALTNWLLLVIIAKEYDPVFLGQFVLALSVISPIFLLFSLKLRTLLVVDLDGEYTSEQYLGTRLFTNTIGLLLALLIGVLFYQNIPLILFLLIALYKWFDGWSELFYAYYHRSGCFKTATISQCLRSLFSIMVIIIMAQTSLSALWMIVGWVLISGLFSIIDALFFAKIRFRLDSTATRWLALFNPFYWYKSPLLIAKKYYTLGLALVVGAMFVYIPNFVIEKYSGIAAAGQFAAVSYFLIAGGILIHSVSQASSPRLASLAKAGDWQSFTSLTTKMCLIGAAIGLSGIVVAIVFGEFFLRLFYNAEIAKLSTELIWVLIAAAIRYVYIFIGTAMNALKQFQVQTYIYTVGTLSVLISCLLLVPSQGTLGAAKAMVIATLFEGILFAYFFWKNLHKRQLSND